VGRLFLCWAKSAAVAEPGQEPVNRLCKRAPEEGKSRLGAGSWAPAPLWPEFNLVRVDLAVDCACVLVCSEGCDRCLQRSRRRMVVTWRVAKRMSSAGTAIHPAYEGGPRASAQ
jgi:hypothetical protein